MTSQLLDLSMRNRAVVLVATVVLLAVGLWSALHLPIDAVPDITGVQVQVSTEVAGLAGEEAESLVTRPLEVELAGLPGVKEMRSLTKFGLSQVTLQFSDDTDIYRARQLVAERIQGAAEELPPNTAPKLAPITTGLGEIFYYALRYKPEARSKPTNETEQLAELGDVQEYFVKPLLRTVPGLAEINSIGGHERQYLIQPRPEALAAAGLTISELAAVIEQNVQNAGGGAIDRAGQQLTVRSVGRVTSLEEIAEVPIKFGGGVRPLLVRDVADVRWGTAFRSGAATLDGRETVIGTTLMLAGQNSREVGERVKARIAEIAPKLPDGIELLPVYDRAELIDRTIATVRNSLFEGAVLVAGVLLLLLGNWRAALIVVSAIPLAFLFALTGMVRGGVSGNLMSLGALDFGLVIDGAVVIVENIVRQIGARQHKLGRALTGQERSEVVLSASKQVAAPMFFGVVIITIVYLPILALTGIEGKMFRPMAITVMLALAGALLLALTLMPVLASFALGGNVSEGENALMRLVKRLYVPSLDVALRFRPAVVIAAALLFVVAVVGFQRLGAEFMPKLDEGAITAMFYKPVGTSLAASVQRELDVEKRLLADFPELTHIFSRIGTSAIASDPMPPNQSDLYLFYRPLPQWPMTPGRPRSKAELRTQLETTIRGMDPGYDILFAQPIEMRFNEMLEGTRAELSLKIFGDNYNVLDQLAEQVKDIVAHVPGAAQVEHETEGRTPQLQISTRRDALQRYNLPVHQVNRAVETALAGHSAGVILDGNRRRDIVVRLPDTMRADEEEVRKLPLRVGEVGLASLGDVARFETVETVDPILRDGGQRRAALMINLDGSDVVGFVQEAERRLAESVSLPDGYFIEFGGQFKNLQEARARLAIVVPSALLLIFVLIFFAFGSIRQALLVYSGIPLALTGGVAALWLRGMPFSITAAVGFIALSGVAVLNGLVLVTYFNQLREEGLALRDAVRLGSETRLRPVLMTALVASLGFVPMAIATGAGAEVQRPLATVVIGGILSSTILTLIVLPVLYSWFESDHVFDEYMPPEAKNL